MFVDLGLLFRPGEILQAPKQAQIGCLRSDLWAFSRPQSPKWALELPFHIIFDTKKKNRYKNGFSPRAPAFSHSTVFPKIAYPLFRQHPSNTPLLRTTN